MIVLNVKMDIIHMRTVVQNAVQTNARHATPRMETVSHVKQPVIMKLTNVCYVMKELPIVCCVMENKTVSNVNQTNSSWRVQHHAKHVTRNQNVSHVHQLQTHVNNVEQDSIQMERIATHVNHKIVHHVIHSMERVILVLTDISLKEESVTVARKRMENIVDCAQLPIIVSNVKTIIS